MTVCVFVATLHQKQTSTKYKNGSNNGENDF